MKQRRWLLWCVAVLTALLLCGCSQYDSRYEDESFLTDGANHFATIMWWGNDEEEGSYSLSAGSFTGVRTLVSFTVSEDKTLCEVESTLARTRGEAKLLVVNTKEKTLVAQWSLDSQDPMTVTLPAGRYDLRIAGKSAGFKGDVSVTLNGQPVSSEAFLEAMQKKVEEAVSGKSDLLDSLRRTFGDGQKAA